MSQKVLMVIGFTAFLTFFACGEEAKYDVYREDEKRYFDLYIQKNYPDLSTEDEGFYYIEYLEGTGASVDSGDWVLINYLTYKIPSEIVVDTYTEEWAREFDLYSSQVLYGPYKVEHGSELLGLRKGIANMKEGGRARLIFTSDYGYGEKELGKIGKFQSLMYDIELVQVLGDPVEWEQKQISEFIADSTGYETITDEDTEAVIYYFEEEKGDSLDANGNNVPVKEKMDCEVFYTGWLLDGREFDSNEGKSSGLKVTVGDEEVIRGWDLGLQKFNFGGKGWLLIPHDLAYGIEGKEVGTEWAKTAIPPYEALLFRIEVTKKSYD